MNEIVNKFLMVGDKFMLEMHTLTAEKIYTINFAVTKKKICLSLHYNEQIVISLSMVQKFINLKQNILRLWQLHYV